MKRFISLLTAAVMALTMGLTSMAAETPSLGIIGGADGPTAVLLSGGLTGLKGPYEGVNIYLNDGYMTFTDALPREIDGRTQAPYRAVLEALGAEVAYDNGNIEARFEDGSVMRLAIGSKDMSYTYADGRVNNVSMDVAPFIDDATGRTYVPIRFIGETLGYTVTWNNSTQSAFVIDWDALEETIDAQFTNINAMMKAAMASQVNEKLASDSELTLTVRELTTREKMSVSLKGSELTDGANSSGSYTLGLDLPATLTEIPELKTVLDMVNGARFDIILSVENGLYLRSALLPLLTSGAVPQDAWLYMDINSLYKELVGMDLSQIMAESRTADFTMGKLLRALFESGEMSETMGMPADAGAKLFAAIYQGMFGNDAVTVRTSGSTVTYTLSSDTNKLFKGLGISDEDLREISRMLKFNMDMRVVTKSDVVTSMSMDMSMDMAYSDDEAPISIKANVKGDTRNADGTISISAPGSAEIVLDVSTDAKPTDSAPQLKPADGEKVVSFTDLVNLLNQ